MKVWISFHPLSTLTTAARYWRLWAQTRGAWRALLLFGAARQRCAVFLAMLHLLSLAAQSPQMTAKKRDHRWVIENAVKLPGPLWRHVTAFLLVRWPAVIARGIPGGYISHTFLHVCIGLCCGGCHERDADDKLGSRAEWGLSKLCCIRWWWRKTNAYTQDKIMPAVQNKDKWLLSVTYSLSLSGRSSLLWCLLSLEWEMTLKQKIGFLLFCTGLLICTSASWMLKTWKQYTHTHTHKCPLCQCAYSP